MSRCILVFDIGNTNVTAAVYPTTRGTRAGRTSVVPLSRWKVRRPRKAGARWWKELAVLACAEAGVLPASLDGSAVSSVVPAATRALVPVLRRLTGRTPLVVLGSLPLGLRHAYSAPATLGPDRICAMLAAVERYGVPVIVADCGTAITVDAVGTGRRHLGGMIAPGIAMSARALAAGTAALPETQLHPPSGPAGSDTASGIRAGSWYSAVGAIREAVSGLKALAGRRAVVVGTGGDAPALARVRRLFDAVEPDLVVVGAAIAWRLTSRRRGGKR